MKQDFLLGVVKLDFQVDSEYRDPPHMSMHLPLIRNLATAYFPGILISPQSKTNAEK